MDGASAQDAQAQHPTQGSATTTMKPRHSGPSPSPSLPSAALAEPTRLARTSSATPLQPKPVLPSPSALACPASTDAKSGTGAVSAMMNLPEQQRSRLLTSKSSSGYEGSTRHLWQRAFRKVNAVAALATARDRWVATHGEKRVGVEKHAAHRNATTRKAFRQEYKQAFGQLGVALKKQPSKRDIKTTGTQPGSPQKPVATGSTRRGKRRSGTPPVAAGASGAVRQFNSFHDLRKGMEARQTTTDKARCCATCTYRLEEAFTNSRGKAIGLCTFAVLQVVVGAVLLFSASGIPSEEDFAESVWESWTYVAGM